MRVKKAIIPAAGLGTRFLPATKAMPKEMLPIVDTPTIQLIIEEAVASGIEDIIIVTGKNKRAIEDHFDSAAELERTLSNGKKFALLEEVQRTSNMVDIHYIRQKEPKGLGHAVWCARKFIGNEPFAVLLGDDIVDAEEPCLKQMLDAFDDTPASLLGVQPMPRETLHRYGIVDPVSEGGGRRRQVQRLVEKPNPSEAPSNLAILGRYILSPRIFEFLASQEPGAGGEVQLTDAISRLAAVEPVEAFQFEGKRFDVGEKFGFLEATIHYALQYPELRERLIDHMQDVVTRERSVLS
ncbi:UTP--glucose-1-phosphate uridylyltransferase GalU [Alkalicoccus chagannorensis]|uniref:UTP--glucose-1-phosphate uridylyltransferase GalU n=1 Tax=Alkalicoccus chagannorensis TaxID=427072 RepID=UPI000401CC13|nr:UTP--glucose-1-phosphate uridylyltransferase GalU [Alkalicoccus chagannorensis]